MSRVQVFGTRALVVLALVGGMIVTAVPGAVEQRAGAQTTNGTQHPSHMHAALHELKHARKELHEAKHNFGGHKEKAIEAVDHAIHQLEKAIEHHRPVK